jgi:DNA-binding PadR family transcriptional regulator
MLKPDADALTPTSYALLGQLALRPWSVYEMTANVSRTLHWFWPRAESVLYAEVKRLAAEGYASVSDEPGSRGRPRRIYAITEAGRAALATWLASPSGPSTLHSEPLLRIHLSPFGTREQLLAALDAAGEEARALLRQALVIGQEFADERHQFQEHVHIRAILFDALWSHAVTMLLWSDRSRAEVRRWRTIDADGQARRQGLRRIRTLMSELPPAAVPAVSGRPGRSVSGGG